MTAKLIQPTDPIEVSQICALCYGQPGSRKSSLCQTADEPITLAMDPGIYRAYGRKTAALFDTWRDVLDFNLDGYKTVVVDTIGMCLDKLGQAVIADSPKNGNRLGGLSLQGYGQLKVQFAAWVTSCRARGQDLVFTAHEKVERNGDDPYYCPDIIGGSYATVMNVADCVGYLHHERGRQVIDFAPTDRWMAKSPPCGWGQLPLPDFGREPDYLARLLSEAKASMGRVSAASAEIAGMVEKWQDFLINSGSDIDRINAALPDLGQLSNGVKKQAWHATVAYCEEHGFAFDREAKRFVAKGAA